MRQQQQRRQQYQNVCLKRCLRGKDICTKRKIKRKMKKKNVLACTDLDCNARLSGSLFVVRHFLHQYRQYHTHISGQYYHTLPLPRHHYCHYVTHITIRNTTTTTAFLIISSGHCHTSSSILSRPRCHYYYTLGQYTIIMNTTLADVM